MNDAEFLSWIRDRLIERYGENPNADYMHRLTGLVERLQKESFSKSPTPTDSRFVGSLGDKNLQDEELILNIDKHPEVQTA